MEGRGGEGSEKVHWESAGRSIQQKGLTTTLQRHFGAKYDVGKMIIVIIKLTVKKTTIKTSSLMHGKRNSDTLTPGGKSVGENSCNGLRRLEGRGRGR